MRVCRGGSFVALAYSLITPWSWAEENPKEAITRLGGRVDEFVEDGHVVYVEVKFSRVLGPFTSLKPLARLPRIDTLYVEDAGIGDPALRTIGQRTELTVLDVSRSFATDQGIAHLQHLTNLEVLYLNGTITITDKGIAHLARLRNLRVLWLCNTRISDAGLRQLAPLSELEHLSIRRTRVTGTSLGALSLDKLGSLCMSGSPITDDGLASVRHFPALGSIRLDNTEVTDRGVEHVLRIAPKLQSLWLQNTKVSDRALAAIASDAPQIMGLMLQRTAVTDEGLRHLGKLKHLKYLALDVTNITDDGLKHLENMELKDLSVGQTKVTREGVERLKERIGDVVNTPKTDYKQSIGPVK